MGSVAFKHLARAQITGQTVGMLMILFHTETLQILGIQCFGQSASEIIHIGQAIMCQPSPNNSVNISLIPHLIIQLWLKLIELQL